MKRKTSITADTEQRSVTLKCEITILCFLPWIFLSMISLIPDLPLETKTPVSNDYDPFRQRTKVNEGIQGAGCKVGTLISKTLSLVVLDLFNQQKGSI